MQWNRISLELDALDLFETITEIRVVRVVLKLASPGRKLTMQEIGDAARLPLTQAKRGIATALANRTLVAVGLKGKEKLRTYSLGPKLAPFVWAQNVPESDKGTSVTDTECAQTLTGLLRLGTKRDQTLSDLSDMGTKSAQTSVAAAGNGSGTGLALKGTNSESIKPLEEKKKSKSCNVPAEYPPEFGELWRAYGRLVQKPRAFRAWTKVPVIRHAELLRAARNMAVARPDPQYRPYLERFIRNEWEDWINPTDLVTAKAAGDSTKRKPWDRAL